MCPAFNYFQFLPCIYILKECSQNPGFWLLLKTRTICLNPLQHGPSSTPEGMTNIFHPSSNCQTSWGVTSRWGVSQSSGLKMLNLGRGQAGEGRAAWQRPPSDKKAPPHLPPPTHLLFGNIPSKLSLPSSNI